MTRLVAAAEPFLTLALPPLLPQAEKVALIADTIVESCAVTFYVWPVDAAWLAWRRSVQAGARGPTALQRAQVAVLLAAGAGAKVPSPVLAAAMALALSPEDELPLSFFKEAAGAVSFNEPQLQLFRAAVRGYLEEGRCGESGAWQAHAVMSDEPPAWLANADAATALLALAPSCAAQGASRGLLVLSGAGEGGSAALRSVRLAAVARLLRGGAPQGDVYEYDPACNTLTKVMPAGGDAPGGPPAEWFVPGLLAALRPTLSDAPADAPLPPPGATLAATAASLATGAPSLRPAEHALYAALCHFAAGAPAADALAQLRALLALPPDAAAGACAGRDQLDAVGEHAAPAPVVATTETALGKPLVDVGSGLNKNDWADLDDKELVARTRAGGSYKTLQAIKPWSPEANAVLPLRRAEAFEYCFLLRREHGALWRQLCESCFASEYAEANSDKAKKKALSARTPAAVLDELRKLKAAGAGTVAWLEALARGNPDDQLLLRRAALRAGPGSPEWTAALASWTAASQRTRAAALEAQHSCTNKTGAPAGAPPMRYKHQEELLALVDEHLQRSLQKGGGVNPAALPLRCILSTPTGSGKTFTALMMSLQLLQLKHPAAILVYSVPTKQVLKRVGQECEAHAAVYWTAARDGNDFQVRRPYSIRTKRTKDERSSGKGSMAEQLALIHALGTERNDRGGGTPSLIVADVYAAAALCAAAAEAKPNSPFHSSRLVLYLDEPNMGIHLSKPALEVVKSIMECAPHTAVLASATLSPWPALPPWWRGDGQKATQRVTITQPPYDLPASRLMLLDSAAGEMRSVAVTDLFPSHAAFASAISADPRLRVLLLRHLTHAQANALLAAADADDAASAAAMDGEGASDGGAPAVDDAATLAASWAALQPDVRTSRETLEAALLRLGPARYESLRRAWREAPARLEAGLGLRGALSTTGVTMIATLEPRRVALELSGWKEGGEEWAERVHALKNKRRESSRVAAAAAKERERESKRELGQGDAAPQPPGQGGDSGSSGLELRPGLVITHEEADAVDDDTLVMLSRGVAFACADGSEGPLVKRLYQQALLHVPEDATRLRLPPIHALVVDYSSVYGTDCPAVDTLVLCDDLGGALTWEDSQQFLGRLRRDGRAVFLSARTLRASCAGDAAQRDEVLEGALESLPRAVQALLSRALAQAQQQPGAAGAPQALATALAALRRAREPHAPSAGEIVRTALAALLERAYPAPPAVVAPLDRASYAPPAPPNTAPAAAAAAAARRLVGSWAPAVQALLRTKADRLAFLRAWEAACAQPGEAAARLLSLAQATLKALYDSDALDEESLLAWAASAKQRADSNADKPAQQLLAKAQAFITWLEEAEDESDEE